MTYFAFGIIYKERLKQKEFIWLAAACLDARPATSSEKNCRGRNLIERNWENRWAKKRLLSCCIPLDCHVNVDVPIRPKACCERKRFLWIGVLAKIRVCAALGKFGLENWFGKQKGSRNVFKYIVMSNPFRCGNCIFSLYKYKNIYKYTKYTKYTNTLCTGKNYY